MIEEQVYLSYCSKEQRYFCNDEMQGRGKFYLKKMEFQKDIKINFIFSSSESWSDIVHLSNNSHRLFVPKFHVIMIRLDIFYIGKYSNK